MNDEPSEGNRLSCEFDALESSSITFESADGRLAAVTTEDP